MLRLPLPPIVTAPRLPVRPLMTSDPALAVEIVPSLIKMSGLIVSVPPGNEPQLMACTVAPPASITSIPLINGIEVIDAGGATVQAINCGSFPGGTLTISPDILINEGTISTANAGSLVISGLTGNLGAVTIGGSGSLSITGTNY